MDQARLMRQMVMAGLLGVLVALIAIGAWRTFHLETYVHAGSDPLVRTTPVYTPPVLAGQIVWGPCSGGFYARHGDTIVLTSTGHCTAPGIVAHQSALRGGETMKIKDYGKAPA